MSQLRHHYPQIRRLGAELLLVTPGPGALLKSYAEELGIASPVLADLRGDVYHKYGLGRFSLWQVRGAARTLWAYARLLLRGRRLRRPRGDLYRLGGDFIIDGEGIVRYAYQSREPTDRPAARDLLAVLATLAGKEEG